MTIAVYGANGYQGRLVSAELVQRDIEMVLIGRDADRLRSAAADVQLPDAQVRVAATGDEQELVAAFGGCDAVINCAGPFTVSGPGVARAAITAGCHYVDVAGEQLYVKQIFDDLSQHAEHVGVTAVPAMNDDNLPASLIAHLAAERVEEVAEVVVAIRLDDTEASRGSLRSALATIEVLQTGGLSYEDGEWLPGAPASRPSMVFPGSSEEVPVVKFPLPPVVTIPRHIHAQRVGGLIAAKVVAALTAITPEMIEGLPEGPAEDKRRAEEFTVVVDVVGDDGRTVRGVVRGVDTYGTTAVIAVEGARRLVADGAAAGVLAPAQAYDVIDFFSFLAPHGVEWTVDVPEAKPLNA